jgi:transposase
MFIDLSDFSIYIKPGRTDMRKQATGLSIIADEEMEMTVQSKSIFLFCSRDRKLLKCLYWDRNGFCLWQKRLEKYKYPWPDSEEAAKQITMDQLKMLLNGIDFFKAHKEVIYEEMN